MREYASTLAQPSLHTALIPFVVQCFKSVVQRRKIRNTSAIEGQDIFSNFSGSELSILLALPLSCDILLEAERINFLKTRQQDLE